VKWFCVRLAALCVLFSLRQACASTLYGESFDGEVTSLWSIDQSTGAATFLHKGAGIMDLASDTRPGSFRIWGIVGRRALMQVDPVTGNQPTVGFTSEFIDALAFNNVDGTLYGVGSSSLYRIDPATAATTLVGRTGYGSYNALGADLNGNLFGVTLVDNLLVRINPATGIGQAIGTAGAAGISDLAVRPEDGVMFGVRNTLPTPTQFDSYRLLTIDVETAATTLIGSEQSTPTTNKTMAALAFSPAVPEPSVFVLIASLAAALVLGSARWKSP
jgi:hypothetical protein